MGTRLALFILLITFIYSTQSITDEQIAQYHEKITQLIEKTPDLSYLASDSPLLDIVKHKELTDLVVLMLKHKANPNVQDRELLGDTPLHTTAWNNNTQAALLLLHKKANINSKNRSSYDTPVHLAVSYNSYDVLHLLLRFKAYLNEKNNYGHTPLHEALQKDIFHKGLRENRLKVIQLLLHYGADPLAQNKDEENCLTIARKEYARALQSTQADESNKEIHQTEAQNYKKIAQLLIAYTGLYTKQSRIAREGLAQVLPAEIAYRIASYLPEYIIYPAQEQLCPICLAQDTEPKATLTCSHNYFHVACIEQWKEMETSTAYQCPLCRKQFT